jgi:hypothetical protein
MTRRLCLMLVCALAPVALVTGCGGSSSHTTTTNGVSSSTIDAAKRNSASAYRNCQSAVANPALTPTEKATLQSECAAIKSGDASALRAAGNQLCKEEAALLPAADGAKMLASCKALAK